MFNNEVDVYSSLNGAETGYEHVVKYFGSFTQQGKSTIILEWANDGDLQSFFNSVDRPYRQLDRREFWASFFRLLMGLHATHNLNATQEPPKKQWLLKGFVMLHITTVEMREITAS
jgi:serine/threonine protein kinase